MSYFPYSKNTNPPMSVYKETLIVPSMALWRKFVPGTKECKTKMGSICFSLHPHGCIQRLPLFRNITNFTTSLTSNLKVFGSLLICYILLRFLLCSYISSLRNSFSFASTFHTKNMIIIHAENVVSEMYK